MKSHEQVFGFVLSWISGTARVRDEEVDGGIASRRSII
jgi:hypothetical protein